MVHDMRHPVERDPPRQLLSGDPDLPAVLLLIQGAFSYMDGRIDPPSSMHAMTLDSLDRMAGEGEIWAIGRPVQACFILSPRADSLYLGKLAVAPSARGRGLARRLVELAELRARDLGLPYVELQTRVELVENHATFAALGFQVTEETAHPGYDRPTSLTFRRPVGASLGPNAGQNPGQNPGPGPADSARQAAPAAGSATADSATLQ